MWATRCCRPSRRRARWPSGPASPPTLRAWWVAAQHSAAWRSELWCALRYCALCQGGAACAAQGVAHLRAQPLALGDTSHCRNVRALPGVQGLAARPLLRLTPCNSVHRPAAKTVLPACSRPCRAPGMVGRPRHLGQQSQCCCRCCCAGCSARLQPSIQCMQRPCAAQPKAAAPVRASPMNKPFSNDPLIPPPGCSGDVPDAGGGQEAHGRCPGQALMRCWRPSQGLSRCGVHTQALTRPWRPTQAVGSCWQPGKS